MFNTFISTILSATILGSTLLSPLASEKILASHKISLNDRYPVASVSQIFKDNILLNIAYLEGNVRSKSDVNWDEVRKPFEYKFILNPGKTFAFHDDVLPQYQGKIAFTTNAHFTGQEGFESDGYLYGDGVCHLASLIYWVAKDAGLDTLAPTNHNFMAIPEISKEFGVAIYDNPYSKGSNAQQNLYITNNRENPVVFEFKYDGNELGLTIAEEN